MMLQVELKLQLSIYSKELLEFVIKYLMRNWSTAEYSRTLRVI